MSMESCTDRRNLHTKQIILLPSVFLADLDRFMVNLHWLQGHFLRKSFELSRCCLWQEDYLDITDIEADRGQGLQNIYYSVRVLRVWKRVVKLIFNQSVTKNSLGLKSHVPASPGSLRQAHLLHKRMQTASRSHGQSLECKCSLHSTRRNVREKVWGSNLATFRWLNCRCGPIPVAARSKVWVCGHSLAAIVGSNPEDLGY
jgi:hypothetical protein